MLDVRSSKFQVLNSSASLDSDGSRSCETGAGGAVLSSLLMLVQTLWHDPIFRLPIFIVCSRTALGFLLHKGSTHRFDFTASDAALFGHFIPIAQSFSHIHNDRILLHVR